MFYPTGCKNAARQFYWYRGLKMQAIRSGPWQLKLESGELYNLAIDIAESKNVAKENAGIVARLRELANGTKDDRGGDGLGPGCRPLGKGIHSGATEEAACRMRSRSEGIAVTPLRR